jgi:hypothetical protein
MADFRRRKQAPLAETPPDLPADVATLQAQLTLARKQNAYLHRELATALRQGPLAPPNFPSDGDALRAENVDLRERLTLLTRHHEDLQHRYKLLEHNAKHQRKQIDEILKSLGRSGEGAGQSTLVGDPRELEHVLTQLLALAHPDKWSQGQPATELAHALSVAILGIRQREGRRA